MITHPVHGSTVGGGGERRYVSNRALVLGRWRMGRGARQDRGSCSSSSLELGRMIAVRLNGRQVAVSAALPPPALRLYQNFRRPPVVAARSPCRAVCRPRYRRPPAAAAQRFAHGPPPVATACHQFLERRRRHAWLTQRVVPRPPPPDRTI